MQQIGYLLVDGTTSRGFKHPASATRFGGGVIKPLLTAGLLMQTGSRNGYRRCYRVTDAGKTALREPTP